MTSSLSVKAVTASTLLGTLVGDLIPSGQTSSSSAPATPADDSPLLNNAKWQAWKQIKNTLPQEGPLNLNRLIDEVEKAFPDGTELVDKVDSLYQKLSQRLAPEFDAVFAPDESRTISEAHLVTLQERLQTHYENEALVTIWKERLGSHFNLENDPTLQTHDAIRAWLNDPVNAPHIQQTTYLNLSNLNLKALPPEILSLTALQYLNLSNNQLRSLPDSFGSLRALQELYLQDNQLASLPDSFGSLTALRELDLQDNQLASLPDSFGSLTALRELDLQDNQLTSLPDSFGSLTALYILDLRNNQLAFLPDSLGSLTALEVLYLSNNQLTSLPDSFGSLGALKTLYLYNNQLTSLPDSFGSLSVLWMLNLSNNQLASLPDSFGSLSVLWTLNLRNNQLTSLPDSFGSLAALSRLYLQDNQLTSLPDSIRSLTALSSLYLQGNQLTSLPDSIRSLTALQQIDVYGNPCMFISDEILNMKPDVQTVMTQKKLFMEYPTESSLGDLFKLIATNKDLVSIQNTFDELDPVLQQRIAELAGVSVVAEESSSSAASSSSSEPSSSITIDPRLFDNIPGLGRAVRSATFEKFADLSKEMKNRVYGEICQLADKPKTRDRKWGEKHAFDNMLRFVEALEKVTAAAS